MMAKEFAVAQDVKTGNVVLLRCDQCKLLLYKLHIYNTTYLFCSGCRKTIQITLNNN